MSPHLSAYADESVSTPSAVPDTFTVWPVDAGAFSTRRTCALGHNFHLHPLVQLGQLRELARGLYPNGQCRFIKPGSTVASRFEHAAQSPDGRDIDEVFDRIDQSGAWVALYNVETDPRYREFLSQVTATVRHLVDPEQPGMFDVGGFIFISAPPSVTPFHIDRENNFWLQVAGRKTMTVWDHTDRETVSAPLVEEFIVNASLDEVVLTDDMRRRGREFDTGPGDGVYFPSTSPHMTRTDTSWVTPGDGVSISVAVVFYTDVTRRHAHLHALNRQIRRRGLTSSEPGASELIDRLKAPFADALVKAMKRRGFKRRGF